MIKNSKQAKQFLEKLKIGWKVCKARGSDNWFNIYLNGRMYQSTDEYGLIIFAKEEEKILKNI